MHDFKEKVHFTLKTNRKVEIIEDKNTLNARHLLCESTMKNSPKQLTAMGECTHQHG